MKKMELRIYPDSMLRTNAKPVEYVGKKERVILQSMLVNMERWKGVGLAAPQVGFALRLLVAESAGLKLGIANPVILEGRGLEEMLEGCLSIPGTEVNVARQAAVWIRAVDLENKKVEHKFQGLLARIVQHEIDHLNGVLIIDRGVPSDSRHR